MLDRFKEDAGRSLSEFTDSDHSRNFYLRIIGVGTAINVFSWIAAFVTPEVIAEWVGLVIDVSDKAKAYLLAVPFWSSFVVVYSMVRLRRYRNPTAVIADSDVFAR